MAYERERVILANLDMGFIIHAPDTSIIFSNPKAAEILGLTENQLKGKEAKSTDWKFLRKDGTSLPLEEYPVMQAITTKKKMRNMLFGINRPSTHDIRWVNVNATPIFDNKEEISEIIISFQDITGPKLTEEILEESESRFRVIFNEAPLGIAMIDSLNGAIFSMNPMFTQILGRSLEEMSTINWMSITHPEDILKELDQMALMSAGKINGFKMEKRIFQKDGSLIWVNITIAQMKHSPNLDRHHLYMIEDISARKKIEIDLQQAKIAADSASVIKSRFLDIAAHELRTPVTAFSLLIQLSQKQLEKGYPVEASLLKRLKMQADRISHLVVDLLDVSRLERGVLKLNLEFKDINSVINECVADLKLRQPDRVVKILTPKASVKLNFDSFRIAQVITNILENARRYTDKDSPIEISLETKKKFVLISITDHGPGISDEQKSKLFTPFTRGSDELTSRSTGLGLGLFICSEIIKLHGGKIGVISKMGEGSTFYFELPTRQSK